MNFKTFVHQFFYYFGLEIRRTLSSKEIKAKEELARQDKLISKLKWLRSKEIKTIIDIGANIGQFAEDISFILPDAMVYSFEPLEECYLQLLEKFSQSKRFKAYNLALSNQTGKIVMRRNQYSPSSSFLPMTSLHKQCFPFTEHETTQEVSVTSLDNIATQLAIEKPLMIKIDVQGFEDKVIEGGKHTISQASVIVIEMSIEPLYENQVLFEGIYRMLKELGFSYKGNYDQLVNPSDGYILQVDGIFVKS